VLPRGQDLPGLGQRRQRRQSLMNHGSNKSTIYPIYCSVYVKNTSTFKVCNVPSSVSLCQGPEKMLKSIKCLTVVVLKYTRTINVGSNTRTCDWPLYQNWSKYYPVLVDIPTPVRGHPLPPSRLPSRVDTKFWNPILLKTKLQRIVTHFLLVKIFQNFAKKKILLDYKNLTDIRGNFFYTMLKVRFIVS
jgi:hypothetical protein